MSEISINNKNSPLSRGTSLFNQYLPEMIIALTILGVLPLLRIAFSDSKYVSTFIVYLILIVILYFIMRPTIFDQFILTPISRQIWGPDIDVAKSMKEFYETNRSPILATLFGVPVLFIFLFPVFAGNINDSRYFIDTFTIVFLFAAFSLTLNLEIGFLGLPNFGKVAFIAVGGYTYAFVEENEITQFFWLEFGTFFSGILYATLVTGIFGIILTLPTLRLREDYFAIVTIVAGEILRMVFNNEPKLGGVSGFGVTNVFFEFYNPDATLGGLFIGVIGFILLSIEILVLLGLFYYYLPKYKKRFDDDTKVRSMVYSRLMPFAVVFSFMIIFLNMTSSLGDSQIGIDILALAIPLYIYLMKLFDGFGFQTLVGFAIFEGVILVSMIIGFFVSFQTGIFAVNWYYSAFCLFILVFTFAVMEEVYNSPFGRTLRAIREDDTSAYAIGKSIFWFRLKGLFISSALTGLIGAIFALQLTVVTPQTYLPLLTFQLYIMVIIGGIGNNKGVLFGAATTRILIEASLRLADLSIYYPYFTSEDIMDTGRKVVPANLALIVIGVTFIIFLLYAPEGIFPEKKGDNQRYYDILTLEREIEDEIDGNQLVNLLATITKTDLSKQEDLF